VRRPLLTPLAALVVVGGLAGLGLRIWILLATRDVLDGDEAVVGLMAKHILHGEFPAIYWGQVYGGNQEAFLTAPLVAAFGLSTTVIRVVTTAFWAAATVLVWRIGLRCLDRQRAALAATLFWIWPACFVWQSTRPRGFYGSSLVLGLAVVLLALRLRDRDSGRDYLLLGLALGCGWWSSPQILILALPALAWLVWRRPAALRGLLYVLPATVVGALPWLLGNARHHWYSLSQAGIGQVSLAYAHHLHILGTTTLPMALGLRVPYSFDWLLGVLPGRVLYLVLLAGLAVAAWRTRRTAAPLVLAALAFPVFYFISPFTWEQTDPRYLASLSPVIALLFGWWLRPLAQATVLLAAALAFSVAGVVHVEQHHLPVQRAEDADVPADVDPVIAVLAGDNVHHAFANYWVAWPVTFKTDERIVVATSYFPAPRSSGGRVYPGDSTGGRYPRYYREVSASRDAAYVFVRGGNREQPLRPLLRRAAYRHVLVSGFSIWLPPLNRH
jgi:4-amino-4-deoxy-L-arabinose transferase-like glycosyltransferase